MLRDDDLSRSIRNDLLGRSKRSVWLERFDEHIQASEHPETVWREPPVDILTFCHDFLDRRNLSDFHRDFFAAYSGDDPEKWDETYKLHALCWGLPISLAPLRAICGQ